MSIETNLARRLARASTAALALGVALVAAAPGQQPDLLVSLTSDDQVGTWAVADEELMLHVAGLPATHAWPAATLALYVGDVDGDGRHDLPTDVDAIHEAPAPDAGGALLLSFVSDELGFLDGDVVRTRAGGGLELVWPEQMFVDAIGALDGNVDVDAMQLDADGTLVFSLADDEDSALLSGDQPGRVRDGAILSLAPGGGAATILYTEDDVSAIVAQAIGGAVSIGDVRGLARSPDGALLFCVQSPSASDGAVFSESGVVVSGHTEADFGFSGGGELDALTVTSRRHAGVIPSDPAPAAGSSVSLQVVGAESGAPVFVLAALELVEPVIAAPGWGGLALAFDPMFASTASSVPSLTMIADGLGEASYESGVPASITPVDVVVQLVEVGVVPRLSNPVLIEVDQ